MRCCLSHSYQLAESVDGQLRRMEQDLKEIIEQMNSANAAEDEDSPVYEAPILYFQLSYIPVSPSVSDGEGR